ncbi:unnamed protein product, partial [Mesorhabditis spiculigera]
NDDDVSEEAEEDEEPGDIYKFLYKRMKQDADSKLAKRQLAPQPYMIPGPQEPLPGRSHPSDYWPVFPFQNQYSGGLDLDPSISRHIGGDLNLAIPLLGNPRHLRSFLQPYPRYDNQVWLPQPPGEYDGFGKGGFCGVDEQPELTLESRHLVRYQRSIKYYDNPPERPDVDPGPYQSIICMNLERKAFIFLRRDGQLEYAMLGAIEDPQGFQLEFIVPRRSWRFKPGCADDPVFTIPYIFDGDENGARGALMGMHIFVECARVGCELHMHFRYMSPDKKLETHATALPLGPNGDMILAKPELVKSAYILASNRSFVILAFTDVIAYEKSKDVFNVISVDFAAGGSEQEYASAHRSRKIVDMHFGMDRRELWILMENAHIVCLQWVSGKDEFKLHQLRWMSIPGMQIARSFHAMTPVVYDLTGKCQVMEWGQDATELLGLPRDHYSVHISDRVGVLIDFEDPTAPKGLRMHLWVEQVGCVLPPLVPYDIHKMVAAPVDQLGLSLVSF